MVKKILAGLLAVAVMMSMAACGKNHNAEDNSVTTEPRICFECKKPVEGIGYECDGQVYCGKSCAGPGALCARCGGDIEDILNKIKEENAIENATNPIPGMSEPGPSAILYEGKLYCSEECAFAYYH